MKRTLFALAAILALPLAAGGCSDLMDESTAADNSAALGDALAGTNATQFAAARANFALTEVQGDGLGPIFNERSCGACHANGALGGQGQQIERRYGTLGPLGFPRRSVFVVDKDGVIRYAHRAIAGLTFRRTDELVEAVRSASS